MKPWILLTAALITGCAAATPKFDPGTALAIQPGTSIDEVIARLGKPKMRITGPHGGQLLSWMDTRGGFLTSAKIHGAVLLFDKDGKYVRPAPAASETP